MTFPTETLIISKKLQKEFESLGVADSKKNDEQSTRIEVYDEMITNKNLRRKTERLFKDGHHARAVEEAYKLLDNVVKKKVNEPNTSLSGSGLMQKVFSLNKPILKLNSGSTASEQDEQNGYMQIFAGCMTGIRNPRAHDSDWEDTEERALQLIVFANHLIERAQLAELSPENHL